MPIDTKSSLEKSRESEVSDPDGGNWYVRGFASTPDLDLQEDIVDPSAIKIDYFVKSGWLNFEHSDTKIGVPTENCYVDPQRGLYVEGILFKDKKEARDVWEDAASLENLGVDRHLGFSIEGIIRKRNDTDNRIIDDVVIYNVAITYNPANPNATWEKFVKSFTTGYETDPAKQTDGSVLRREEVAQALTNLTYARELIEEENMGNAWQEVGSYLDSSNKSTKNNAILLLQLSKGISRKDAETFVNKQ